MRAVLDAYRAAVGRGDIRDDLHQQAAIDALQRLYDDLITPKKRTFLKRRRLVRGVYLHGPVGRGKSMVMDLFHTALPPRIASRRVHFHSFMIGVHEVLHRARQDGRTDSALLGFAADLARELDVLCFDEFHVVDIADAMILSRLFTALLDRGLAVVITSNWPPDRLYEGGLQRDRFLPFIALVKDRLDIVALAGPVDYRLRLLEDNGVYRWPLDAAARGWADGLFSVLSGNAPAGPDTLAVRGRVVTVPWAARGVARFSFADLCDRPLGAEDYLAIAGAYHTVFLDGVPKMGPEQRNAAKRLMILVDTLYDGETRLVVTADAPPAELYSGGDHAFEFQRTVSRLLEMQGKDWLERTEPRQTV